MPEPRLPGPTRPSSPSLGSPSEPSPDPLFWGDDARRRDGFGRPGTPGRPSDRGFDSRLTRLTDRLAMLRGDPRVGIALLVLIAVVAGYVWYRAGSGSADTAAPPARVAATSPRASGPTAAVDTPSTSAGNRLFVHVAGRVTKPGVVELPAGSRVIDALEAAGGGLPDADLDRLNLAAKLADGQRVLVQKVGDPAAPADPGAASGGDPAEPGGGGPINLNSATAAQLEELPGIGPSYAAAIIQLRDQRGGFRSVNELRDVRGIGEKRFAELKDLVTV